MIFSFATNIRLLYNRTTDFLDFLVALSDDVMWRDHDASVNGPKEWRNGFRKTLHTRAKMTCYVLRVFRSLAPLKKKLVIKANEEISVMCPLDLSLSISWLLFHFTYDNKTTKTNRHPTLYCIKTKCKLIRVNQLLPKCKQKQTNINLWQ